MAMSNPKVGMAVTVDGHEDEGAALIAEVIEVERSRCVRLDRPISLIIFWPEHHLTRAEAQAKVTP